MGIPHRYSEPAASRFSDDQLLMTARLYYADGLPQADVARLMGVSQPQVSRMLSLARERGIVQITVAEYDPRDRALEQRLGSALGLHTAVVIRTAQELPVEDARRTLAHFAAPFLEEMIVRAARIAVAGGRTLSAVVRSMKGEMPHPGLTVVQAMGNIGPVPDSWDAVELGRVIASRWNCSFLMLNTPAFLPDARTRNALLRLEQIRSVKEAMRQADLALVGVGTPTNSVFVEREVLSPAEFSRLNRSGAVGEICGRYFDEEGRECATPFRDRVISIELDELRSIANVVAVVTGKDRAPALLAAIRGGLIRSLIIDRAAAAALAELADSAVACGQP